MRTRTRGATLALLLAWAGAVGAAVCVLLRYTSPLPRWDVLAALACCAAGVGLWRLLPARRPAGTAEAPSSALVPQPGQSSEHPPGFLLRRRWWPARRGWSVVASCTALMGIALTIGSSGLAATPQLSVIMNAGERVTAVTVQHVVSSQRESTKTGTYYTSTVSVVVPDAADRKGGRGTAVRGGGFRGEVQTGWRVRPGSQLWGLYAPNDPQAGVILSDARGEIDALRGGAAPFSTLFVSALYAGAAILAGVFAWRGPGTAVQRVQSRLRDGTARAARVTVVGASVAWRVRTVEHPQKQLSPSRRSSEPAPALVLASPRGESLLGIARCLDQQALAAELRGVRGWLYWAPADEHREGQPCEAVVVLDDDRYVSGCLSGAAGVTMPLGQSVPVAVHQPGTAPEVRPVGPYVVWQPAVHRPGLSWFAAGFVALALIPTGLVSSDSGLGVAGCAAIAGLAPVVGNLVVARQRSRHLRKLRDGGETVDRASR